MKDKSTLYFLNFIVLCHEALLCGSAVERGLILFLIHDAYGFHQMPHLPPLGWVCPKRPLASFEPHLHVKRGQSRNPNHQEISRFRN